MYRNFLMGSLVLLAIAAIAAVCHNIHFPVKSPSSRAEIDIYNAELFPEQKFLVKGPFDINEATMEELEAIPYIGPSLAKRIMDFRNTHGRIASLEELLEVKGVGPRILEIIRPYLRTD